MASLSACKRGFAPGESPARWQTSLFPSNLRLITHVAKRMDSWAAAFVFQMALGVMGAELPALGHSRMERQDMCVLGSQKSASRWCTRSISRLPVANVGCYHWQYSHQNLFNFSQITCTNTCWITHPGRSWISLVQSCVHSTFSFVSSNCEAAALQLSRSCFDIKGSMTESHRDQGGKSRTPRPKAEPTPCLCNIHSQKCGKKGDSLEISQTWLQVAQEEQLQGTLLDMRVSRESSQVLPSQLLPCHYSRGAIQAVLPRGADLFHPSPGQQKASSNSMTAFQLTSASFLIPCGLCSCFKQHHSNKMIFQEPLWGSSSTPRHGSAVGSALSPCSPCLAPNPKGVVPHQQKAWLHTVPEKVQFPPS